MKCPCCGGEAEPRSGILVDMTSNTIAVAWSNETVRLQPIEAEIAHILALTGRYVAGSYIRLSVWGTTTNDDETRVARIVRDNIKTMRKKIKPLSLSILNMQQFGYKLERGAVV